MKGTTSSGFEYNLDETALDDYELLSAEEILGGEQSF